MTNVNASTLMTFRGYQGERGDSGKFTADGRWYLTPSGKIQRSVLRTDRLAELQAQTEAAAS